MSPFRGLYIVLIITQFTLLIVEVMRQSGTAMYWF